MRSIARSSDPLGLASLSAAPVTSTMSSVALDVVARADTDKYRRTQIHIVHD